MNEIVLTYCVADGGNTFVIRLQSHLGKYLLSVCRDHGIGPDAGDQTDKAMEWAIPAMEGSRIFELFEKARISFEPLPPNITALAGSAELSLVMGITSATFRWMWGNPPEGWQPLVQIVENLRSLAATYSHEYLI